MDYNTGLICLLLILSTSRAVHYVQTGTDKHFCGFKCDRPQGFLDLRCNHTALLVAECSNLVPKIRHQADPRIIQNSSSGCWMLRDAQKNYTGSYKIYFYYGHKRSLLKSIEIIVLDAVKIQNITSNSSLVGSDVSLEVQFSGGKASVLWELDGGSIPPRYILKDDNRTLIIANVGREDAQRILAVWVKNPVSEDKWEYPLVIKVKRRQYRAKILCPAVLVFVIFFSLVLRVNLINADVDADSTSKSGDLEVFLKQV